MKTTVVEIKDILGLEISRDHLSSMCAHIYTYNISELIEFRLSRLNLWLPFTLYTHTQITAGGIFKSDTEYELLKGSKDISM